MKESIKLFEEKKVRALWNETEEEWNFSVVDAISVLTDSDKPQVYWRILLSRRGFCVRRMDKNITRLRCSFP
jgi:hypothetical protein